MRPAAPLFQLVAALSTVTPLVSAWPGWLPELDSLVVAHDDVEGTSTVAETGAAVVMPRAAETATAKADKSKDSKTATKDSKNAKPTSTKKDGKNKSDSKKKDDQKTKSIPPDAAVGGVNIQTPATTAIPTALFKIGDNITLGWNYTGLEITPTAVDVLLSCSTASETWTLTQNMTFETDVSFLWNSKKEANDVESPLLTEMYTLIIKDSEAEVSEMPSPGLLGSNMNFKFGLYAPVPYTPWPEWECTGCSAATALFDTQVVKLAFTMCFITVFTFTWFVTGWGIN